MTIATQPSSPELLSDPLPFRVGESPIHGCGLLATRALVAGELVVEYTGEMIDKAESSLRQTANARVYIFAVDQNWDLDGDHSDNPARFLNHACEPNCEAEAVGGRIWIRTVRAIAKGEELTFDYNYPLAVFPGHPCRCRANFCRGFIVGRADRWRLRRLLNRPGRSLLKTQNNPNWGFYGRNEHD